MEHTEDNKLYCPICRSPLVVTHQGRYQDISEHVSNPNGKASLKDGYQCTNVDWCEASRLKFTWISDGDCFIDPPEGISYGEASRKLKALSVSGMDYALNSFNHYYHRGQNSIKRWTRKISIGKYSFDFIPKEWGYEYPDHKRYEPCWYSWRIEIWKRNSEYGSVMIMPITRMVRFSISKFLSDYKSAIYTEGKSKYYVMDCLEIIKNKDPRTYRKIASFIIRTLYPKKCGVIISIAKREGILKK